MAAVSGHDNEPGRGAEAWLRARRQMVMQQIAARGVRDPRVLGAMERVPRHAFVPGRTPADAYGDHPLPIGQGQTVSQPYIVAFMTEALNLPIGARTLEVGTGCGYQAAVLAEAGFRVWTIEVVEALAAEAAINLRRLGYSDVQVRHGDGALGWLEAAPFDGIIVAAAPAEVPTALFDQLAVGGTLVIPLGEESQDLWRYRRTAGGFSGEHLLPVRFVPMTGGVAEQRSKA